MAQNRSFSGCGRPRGALKPSKEVGGETPHLILDSLKSHPGPPGPRRRPIFSQIQNPPLLNPPLATAEGGPSCRSWWKRPRRRQSSRLSDRKATGTGELGPVLWGFARDLARGGRSSPVPDLRAFDVGEVRTWGEDCTHRKLEDPVLVSFALPGPDPGRTPIEPTRVHQYQSLYDRRHP